jgi:hypothetical protein
VSRGARHSASILSQQAISKDERVDLSLSSPGMKEGLVAAMGLVIALLACKSKKELGPDNISLEEGRKRAALAEPILAAIGKIDPAKIPAVTTETKLPAWPSNWVGGNAKEDEDAIGVYPEDLAKPSELNEVAYAAPHGELARCTQNVAAAKAGKDDHFYKTFLVGCTKLKYVLMVRPTKVVKPRWDTKTTTNETTKTRTEKTAFDKG